jgi:hypothetical protein
MLWADSGKRKKSLMELVNLFHEKGYVKTSEKIIELSKILDLQKIPQDFEKQWASVALQFEKELAQGPTAKFREGCFDDIARLVLVAIRKIGKDFPTKLSEIYNLFHNMNVGGNTAEKIGDIIRNIKDPKLVERRFYLLCFAYLIMVEGIFDECVRILYFLWVNSKGMGLKFQEVKEKKVKDINKEFIQSGFFPTFLQNWEEKNHLRNSIGHARFEFHPNNNLMHFIDVNPQDGKMNYNKFLNFDEFAKIALEIEDAKRAFMFFFLIIKMRDFILSPTPYN